MILDKGTIFLLSFKPGEQKLVFKCWRASRQSVMTSKVVHEVSGTIS